MEKYNTRVIRAMSEEYVKSSKKKTQLQKEYADVSDLIENSKDKLTYREYIALQNQSEDLKRQYEDEQIRFDIWDQAREICLNVADEVL